MRWICFLFFLSNILAATGCIDASTKATSQPAATTKPVEVRTTPTDPTIGANDPLPMPRVVDPK
jgi:hypothetical protein